MTQVKKARGQFCWMSLEMGSSMSQELGCLLKEQQKDIARVIGLRGSGGGVGDVRMT